MKYTKIIFLAALLGTVLASCQKEVDVKPEEQPVVETKGWTLKVNATMDQTTKAMSLSGTELKSYWVENEKVAVYLGTTKLGTLEAGNITNNGANAVLSGELDSVTGVDTQTMLTLIFPDVDDFTMTYLGQDGSAPSEGSKLAKNFDYAMAYIHVDNVNTSTNELTVNSNASFESQQSIYRFRFKEDGSSSYFNVKTISITDSQNCFVRTRYGGSTPNDYGVLTMDPDPAVISDYFYYMAILNENTTLEDIYTFTVVRSTDNAVFEGTKTIPAAALAAPTYIPTGVAVSQKTVAQAAASTTITSDADVL